MDEICFRVFGFSQALMDVGRSYDINNVLSMFSGGLKL